MGHQFPVCQSSTITKRNIGIAIAELKNEERWSSKDDMETKISKVFHHLTKKAIGLKSCMGTEETHNQSINPKRNRANVLRRVTKCYTLFKNNFVGV